LPTAGKVVPSTSNWLHEIKYDGYRLMVARDGNRVRLFTRNGHDWSDRFPWIVESALRNRHKQFVIDGGAVIKKHAQPKPSVAPRVSATEDSGAGAHREGWHDYVVEDRRSSL
jgi:ATP-dependent DNA ligase